MDTGLSEECITIDADPQMTMLQGEAITEHEMRDEVEDLGNSLREAVHDSTIRPKLQCLMMDPSFSMVTVQGEDSGIQWETSSSRASTPWVSDGRTSTLEFCSTPMERSVTPGCGAAGNIIFVMDEEKIVRRKRIKEKDRTHRQTMSAPAEDSSEVADRPELVEVSLPNVKVEEEGKEEEIADPEEEKEQRLFQLVSEGSEILNIMVSPKFATVDEEESKVMEDNLSYLEETPLTKPSNDNSEEMFDPSIDVTGSGKAPTELSGDQSINASKASQPSGPGGTDPPGAPVARPRRTGTASDMDYFETFTLVDAQAAPGSPAVILEGLEETGEGAAGENQTSEEPEPPKDSSVSVAEDQGTSVAISGEDLTSEHLDEVFYGNTADILNMGEEGKDKLDEKTLSKSPLKKSGSALFGSQEDVLTPIFLSPGPPKIIDPALLDEPKAMAFLYTDLYEEALGSRQKDEDAESMTSEKSFHSRHSDREARGYLEKFVLKDETPVVEMEPAEEHRNKEERLQKWSDDALSLLSPAAMPENEDEITDFFRTSASSSPCDAEPFSPLLEEENPPKTKKKEQVKSEEKAPKKALEVPQPQAETSLESLGKESEANVTDHEKPPTPNLESCTHEAGETSVPENPVAMASPQECTAPAQEDKALPKEVKEPEYPNEGVTNQETPKLVAPPRKRPPIALKTTLDLAPLTLAETAEEGEGVLEKEQREEEKEKASPAETADEGEGDGDETEKINIQSSSASSQDASLPVADNDNVSQEQVTPTSEAEVGKEEESLNANLQKSEAEENKVKAPEAEELKDKIGDREPTEEETLTETAKTELAESAKTEVDREKERASVSESEKTSSGDSSPISETVSDRERGRCVIL